jgi:hypothetical protein
MPFSFTLFSGPAILVMIACLAAIQFIKHIRKGVRHLEK